MLYHNRKKMKTRLLLLVTFLGLIVASCKNEGNESPVKTYGISKLDFTSWQDVVKIKEAVVLNSDLPLTYPRKCLVGAGRIVFWDSKAKKVYLFNSDGTFISQVGERGNAQNEYNLIKDIAFNPDSTVIKILDESGILNYSMEDGRFLGMEKIKSDISPFVWNLLPIGDNHYLFYCDGGESTVIDYEMVDGKAKVTGLRKKECIPFMTDFFYKYNGRYRVVSDFGDFYVDDYDNGSLRRKYVFDLGPDALPDEKKPQTFEELEKINNAPEYHKCIGCAFETDQWLYLSVGGLDLNSYDVFINKRTSDVIAGQTIGLMYFGACGNDFWAMPYLDDVKEGSFLYEALKDDIKAYPDSPILLKVNIDEN